MEREEVTKLINVLYRTARSAKQAESAGGGEEVARFCVDQYNRIYARLVELDSNVATIFRPLPDSASLSVTALACRQLAAYFENGAGESQEWDFIFAPPFNPEKFKEFWRQTAGEIEDFGEFIRQNIETWTKRRGAGDRPSSGNL